MVRPALALCCGVLALISALASAAEWNPVRPTPVSIGPQTYRIIVGFRATPANSVTRTFIARSNRPAVRLVQAQTSAADAANLAQRASVALARSRQITPGMHVLFLPTTLYGAEVQATLARLRADPAVEFAEIDERRYALAAAPQPPNDPLFGPPLPGTYSGQWYMLAPNPSIVVEGVQTQDLSATDAQDAWAITTGSSDIVIADVDTGVLFDHPDLLRANLGGRLLPGYDFVGEDYNPNKPYNGLGTYLTANDGDGWDPDPSDPGDWISSTDLQNTLFPPSSCGDPQTGGPVSSTWHGTRVVGIFGAITDNDTGIAGMTWGNAQSPGPWILPVRALGKCGGYDSDIIAGIAWAAGLTGTNLDTPPNAATSSTPTIPPNPYPADIINLSLGGSGACSTYETVLQDVTKLGVLVVASAGNGGSGTSASVTSPANCSLLVPGVIAVAGLRNVGTKVGYSSFGQEVGVSAPAGNCINPSGNCLRSIDSTTNSGTTDPAGNTYTNEQNPNLGTSFSAPIVSGIAALMRSVNANLTPAQLVARLESSAAAFPSNNSVPPLPVCPSTDSTSGECSCPAPGPGVTLQCGTGMVNALNAVRAALHPIGVIVPPATPFGGAPVFDASGSVASCANSIASFQWTTNTSGLITSGANTPQVTLAPSVITSGNGTLTLVVTDSNGNADTETVVLSATAMVSSTAPTSAGTAATACPGSLATNPAAPAAPTVTPAFSQANVYTNAASTLTITIGNTNGFDLTYANFSLTLPAGLKIASTPKARTSCFGTQAALANTSTAVTLSNAIVPASGQCAITLPVSAASAATYPVSVAAGILTTGPAGANVASAAASLTVTPAPSGGGGQIGWPDLLLGASALLLMRGGRGRYKR
ncbi:MAG: S8 family serine peptidase [Steroidobacterales bacterium]